MQPADVIFGYGDPSTPGWAWALAKELARTPGLPQEPGPVAFLRELKDLISDRPRTGVPGIDVVRSLCADVRTSMANRGGAYSLIQASEVLDLASRPDSLHRVLKESFDDARELEGVVEDCLTMFLDGSGAVAAAWRDVIAAFGGGESADGCAQRLELLAELIEGTGAKFKRLGSQLAGVLIGHSHDVWIAQGSVGPRPKPADLCRVAFDDRLELAGRMVSKQAAAMPRIAWIQFRNARLDSPFIDRGWVSFYDGHLWPAIARDWPGAPPGWSVPPEFADPGHTAFFPENGQAPGLHGSVIARLDIGATTYALAAEHALAQARDIIALANWNSGWKLSNSVALHDPNGWSGSPLGRAQIDGRSIDSFDPITGARVAELERKYLKLARRGTREAEALRELHYLERVERAPDAAQRQALRWRTLEGVLATKRNPQAKVREYLRERWVLHEFELHLRDAAVYGVGALSHTATPSAVAIKLREQLLPSTGDQTFQVRIGRLPALAREMARYVPTDSLQQRMLLDAERLGSDRDHRMAWFRGKRTEFERLVARSLRQRHAVMHGRAVSEAVVRSVEQFGEHLAALAVNALIEAEADGIRAPAVLERHRDAADLRIRRVEAGEDLAAIYPA